MVDESITEMVREVLLSLQEEDPEASYYAVPITLIRKKLMEREVYVNLEDIERALRDLEARFVTTKSGFGGWRLEKTVSEDEILRRRQQETIEGLRVMGPRASPWSNPEPEAIVEEAELKTFAEWLLAAVKRVWETKKSEIHWEWLIEPVERGVLLGLRGVSRPHEFFSVGIIDKIGISPRALFVFGNEIEYDLAASIFTKHGIAVVKGATWSLQIFESPDYVLDVLASEGFDTSKILVER